MGYIRSKRWHECSFTWEGLKYKCLDDFFDTILCSPKSFRKVKPGKNIPLQIVKEILSLSTYGLLDLLNAKSSDKEHLITLLEEKFRAYEKQPESETEPFFLESDVFGTCKLRGRPQDYAINIEELWRWTEKNPERLPENRPSPQEELDAQYEVNERLRSENDALKRQLANASTIIKEVDRLRTENERLKAELAKLNNELDTMLTTNETELWGLPLRVATLKKEGMDVGAIAELLRNDNFPWNTIGVLLHPTGTLDPKEGYKQYAENLCKRSKDKLQG